METGAEHGRTGEEAWTIMTMDGAECMSSGVHIHTGLLCWAHGLELAQVHYKRKVQGRLPPARHWAGRHNNLPTALCMGRCPTRAWCVLATTYSEDAQSCITMVDITAAGLVPMAALFEQSGLKSAVVPHTTLARMNQAAQHITVYQSDSVKEEEEKETYGMYE